MDPDTDRPHLTCDPDAQPTPADLLWLAAVRALTEQLCREQQRDAA